MLDFVFSLYDELDFVPINLLNVSVCDHFLLLYAFIIGKALLTNKDTA